MLRKTYRVLIFALCFSQVVAASPLSVPESLKAWQSWALWGQEEKQACPKGLGQTYDCVWPGTLAVAISQKNATFSLETTVFYESWVALPGDHHHWPTAVYANDAVMPVIDKQGQPFIRLSEGEYQIKGQFVWSAPPQAIQIPPTVGMVEITRDRQPLTDFKREPGGRIWLTPVSKPETKVENRLGIKTFRRLRDSIPFQDTLRLNLTVAGQAREVVLGPILLADFSPVSIKASGLPARLESDGRLRLQIRPGEWQVELTAIKQTPVSSLTAPPAYEAGPSHEVWVFEPQPMVHLTQVNGAKRIDPTQTALPQHWQHLAAYYMPPEHALTFTETQRGKAPSTASQLQLQRTFWLDFQGQGFMVRDEWSGQLADNRLNVAPPLQLGRVTAQGRPQLVTESPTGATGVELRNNPLAAVGWSQLSRSQSTLPAIGWAHDVQNLSAELQLPPGWQLLTAFGPDSVAYGWLDRWSLLDLFLVLVTAAVVSQLFGKRWGLLACLALFLTYHERGAPVYSWLLVLSAIALLRVLPKGALKKVCQWYYSATLAILALVLLPFAVDQIRLAMFPELAVPSVTRPDRTPPLSVSSMPRALKQQVQANAKRALREESLFSADAMGVQLSEQPPLALDEYDPNAKIQTGPGEPAWRWQAVQMDWQGPVLQSQTLTLWLIPPWLSRILHLACAALTGLLAFCMVRAGAQLKINRILPSAATTVVVLGMSIVLQGLFSAPVQAAFPSPEMLDTLKTRLLAPDDCEPHCMTLAETTITATESELQVRFVLNVLAARSVPLLNGLTTWAPTAIQDAAGQSHPLNRRDEVLQVYLPAGQHSIELKGPLPTEAFSLNFALSPKHVKVAMPTWTVSGLRQHRLVDNTLQFEKSSVATQLKTLTPSQLPPFVKIKRHLILGMSWQIETVIERVAPSHGSLTISVPLLPGEKILSEQVAYEGQHAVVQLKPKQRRFTWVSDVPMQAAMTLTAPANDTIAMQWSLQSSPMWHVEAAGVPMLHQHQRSGPQKETWALWPGETVDLLVTKPAGVLGDTLTIDRSDWQLKVGQHALEADLSLTMRASQGGTHKIQLPEQSVLKAVTVDGVAQPLQLEDHQLTLPIQPGEQTVKVQWHWPTKLSTLFTTPAVALNHPSANSTVGIGLGHDRWILAMGGAAMGPVVLFWGVAIVVCCVALGLGRMKTLPLGTGQWILLGLGLAVAAPWATIGVLLWFFALAKRRTMATDTLPYWVMAVIQSSMILLTVLFIISVLYSISNGLLGAPEMQLTQPYSPMSHLLWRQFPGALYWYQDQVTNTLPAIWVVSLPMTVYRLGMLLWSLWLAFSIIRWFKWGWQSFSAQGLWPKASRSIPLK